MSVPKHVEYRRCAVQRQAFAGPVPMTGMARLAAAVVRLPVSDAQVELAFAEDDQRRVRLTGRITAPVLLRCQRCSTTFESTIDTVVAGVVVADDAAAAGVPHADEPILAAGDWLDVQPLVEDELLLALPMVARCNNTDCQTRYNRGLAHAHADSSATAGRADKPNDNSTDNPKNNPFAALEQLRHGNNKDASD